MTLDVELVTRKLVLITSDLELLRPIAARGVDDYLQSRVDQAVVERYLERIVGRMIDINYHVITESGGAPPADCHASFTRLAELKVLDPWCPVCRCCHHLADVAGTESRRESPSRADRERRRKP